MIGIIFFLVVIVNAIGFCFIVKNFFRQEIYSGKNSSFSTMTKVFSVILNLVLAYGVFWGFLISFMFMSTRGIFYNYHKIYVSDFYTGFLLLETLFFLPYGINLFLYKVWYRKNNLCKWWIFPALVIGAVTFLLAVSGLLIIGYIKDWSTAEWR